MSDLYDSDILIWWECPATLLHRRTPGAPLNEAEIDWLHVS